jgi:hypothetical protein
VCVPVCTAFAAALLAVACGDALSPEFALGTWHLTTVNGEPVPGAVTLMDGTECDYEYDILTLISITETRLDGSAGRFENDYKLRCGAEVEWRGRILTGTYNLNTETERLVIGVADKHFWELAIEGTRLLLTRHGVASNADTLWNAIDNELVYRKK